MNLIYLCLVKFAFQIFIVTKTYLTHNFFISNGGFSKAKLSTDGTMIGICLVMSLFLFPGYVWYSFSHAYNNESYCLLDFPLFVIPFLLMDKKIKIVLISVLIGIVVQTLAIYEIYLFRSKN